VKIIRRITVIIITLILLFGLCELPVQASAAASDSQAGQVTISSGYLNVRSTASSGGAKVASLSKGSFVTLISRSGSWWRVEYAKGKYGYCHADYIKTVTGTPVTVQTNSSSLNVRSGPGTSYGKTGVLAKGETVLLLSTANGWSRVLYHGTKTGYVSAQYLSSGYSAVSLWVRNWKQFDTRWAQLEVATSGKTFAQIGCATTAIAMVEGHRTGKTITPDEMARQLRYTPSGSVYWPEHYTVVTNGAELLNGIYNRLKQGKPVLFGATNAYGSQHWVVITGFAGGNSLTASRFTIHDPGSNSRTNLQQFLSVYPNFYKYFYY
jgi:uncharacterized protein YgiM (DUF1202 family)